MCHALQLETIVMIKQLWFE